jgi:hypothetical protein
VSCLHRLGTQPRGEGGRDVSCLYILGVSLGGRGGRHACTDWDNLQGKGGGVVREQIKTRNEARLRLRVS